MLHCGRCTFWGWTSVAAAPPTHYYTMLHTNLLGALVMSFHAIREWVGPKGVQDPRRAISGARQRLRDNFLSFVPNFDTTPEGLIPVAEAQGSQPIPGPPPPRHDLRPCSVSAHQSTGFQARNALAPQDPASYGRTPRLGLLLDCRLQEAGRRRSRDNARWETLDYPDSAWLARPKRLACSTVANAARRYLRPRNTASHLYTERESTESAPWLALRGETPSCSLG